MIRLISKFILLFAPVAAFAQTCLDVNGLQFEKIDSDKLLVSRAGKNIAIITTRGIISEGPLQFRFFSPTLCTAPTNHRFHINGRLFAVEDIQILK